MNEYPITLCRKCGKQFENETYKSHGHNKYVWRCCLECRKLSKPAHNNCGVGPHGRFEQLILDTIGKPIKTFK